jgi:N-methylhydantoinase A
MTGDSSTTTTRVAIDVGGTFTDLFILDERQGRVSVAKVPSTPDDPAAGILAALEHGEIDLGEVGFLSHGSTVATNALITRRLPSVAMVTTRGFRDIIEVRRGNKDELWDVYDEVAPPYIPRRHRVVVTERIDWTGKVIEPLDEDEARAVARTLGRRGIEAIAVCFINSFMNPEHEDRMREILLEELSDVIVSTSSEVLPEIFEHERFSTTVVNTCLTPVVGPYVRRLSDGLRDRGYRGDLLLFHSGGGVITPSTAERFGARLAGSGIAAGAIACQQIAKLAGHENAIGLDMGGTSTDISLVKEGELHVTNDWGVEFGYPIGFPAIDVHTIGAGGGSLAWIDDGGSLRNGPQSAGADPGPACYGRGNSQATNSDANVVLGRLGTELLGGAMTLDVEAARAAVERTVAGPLGMTVPEAAQAIIDIANANMADAVRVVSIGRGHDPRDFTLVVFGGAGALHGAHLARELSIPTVIVPPQPGITSALGCLLVDVRHDLSKMVLAQADDMESSTLDEIFASLEEEGNARLEAEGVPPDQRRFERSVDMRYLGQWRSINIAVSNPAEQPESLISSFHEGHETAHYYRRDGAAVELYRANVTAIGLTPDVEFPDHPAADGVPASRSTRTVHFDGEDLSTPIFWRDDLGAGHEIEGPAIVEQLDSTTVIPPGVRAVIDSRLNIVMAITEV